MLRGVDFDAAPGSIFALLGSNGAGRTTVVKILSTLLKSDAGTATVDGFDVATQPADVRESTSLTGQFAAVDEILTGRENLVLVARLRRVEGPGQVADDLLARFQLTDAAGRSIWTRPNTSPTRSRSLRLLTDMQSGIFARFQAMPIARFRCGSAGMASIAGILVVFTLAATHHRKIA
ncbi:ATP-binding cassette domain-containing protein [Actinomadura sp. DC4]|uniref:ATP-binding cassette domain-containing protein n=1 Tax=Actinomadura sp. DC4 TaxID=3055069 RepID=UPI0025AF2880|nr:ATP-binding cassette domain-containing protein [Actinomadura sp. DC4]MDN3359783.1 ATP-binding cassette domain-containing protein [Actinomadura sp. DC4]